MAYSEKQKKDIFKSVCERMTNGEALIDILRSDNMPSRNTFYIWINNDLEKYDMYTRAREERADYLFEQILEIADKQSKDIIIIDGEEVINHNVIQRNRLQIDARKWVASKMNPKKYGDKVDITTDNKPITPQETSVIFVNARKDKDK